MIEAASRHSFQKNIKHLLIKLIAMFSSIWSNHLKVFFSIKSYYIMTDYKLIIGC